jgi:hypothetical protein
LPEAVITTGTGRHKSPGRPPKHRNATPVAPMLEPSHLIATHDAEQ